MNTLQKIDEILEDYKELCEFFKEAQKPLEVFRPHYGELKKRLHDEKVKINKEDTHETPSTTNKPT